MRIRMMIAGCAIFATPPAMAAELPFKVAPTKTVRTSTYYQSTAVANCSSDACIAYFPKIKGAAVIFSRVSCVVVHATPIAAAALGIAENKTDTSLETFATLPIPPSFPVGTARYSQFNQEVLLRVAAGDVPAVLVLASATGNLLLNCVAVGAPER